MASRGRTPKRTPAGQRAGAKAAAEAEAEAEARRRQRQGRRQQRRQKRRQQRRQWQRQQGPRRQQNLRRHTWENTLNRRRKLTLIDDERAAALDRSKVSGVHFKVTHVDPATGWARHDTDADITVRVGHGQSYAFDGVANAAFLHAVANADNPYPDLERITVVTFMVANDN
jgi:hypothetical protein